MKFNEYCEQLENKIKASYEEGVTLEQAEKLAGEFLGAMMRVSNELRNADLDSRMRKSGVKAIRASAYLAIVGGQDKKPTETHIQSILDKDGVINNEQDALDTAEVLRDNLKRYYDIFNNAHVFYRGVAKGNFGS